MKGKHASFTQSDAKSHQELGSPGKLEPCKYGLHRADNAM